MKEKKCRGSDESGPCSCPISLDPEGSGPKGIGLGNTETNSKKEEKQMSKKLLLLLTVGLVCGMAGLAYGDTTATINVTATVGVELSLTPSATSYAFGTDLLYGTTYHGYAGTATGSDHTPVIFTNDGCVKETLQVKWTGTPNWTYADGGSMFDAPTGNNNAKIGGNWGDTPLEVKAMTGLTDDGTTVESGAILVDETAKLWLGIWTPASLSSSSKYDGAVSLTVTCVEAP